MDEMTDMSSRTPPNDEAAEQGAIHVALSRGRIPEPLSVLRPADFYRPAHESIWAVMLWLLSQGRACDANGVMARLQETKQFDLVPLLPQLVTVPWAVDPDSVAGIILDRAGRRHIIETGTRLLQRAWESDQPYEAVLGMAEAELAKVPARDTGDVDSLQTLDEFLGEEVVEPEWVIDGLLARGERLILTGGEGLGKSTLTRQLGLCTAAGIEPFTGRAMEPKTVLIVDAENPKFIMQKRYGELRRAINAHGHIIDSTRLWLDRRPEGMDLSDPADLRWLQRRVTAVNPDLIVIGPAYKLHAGSDDVKDETIARQVTAALDAVRGDAALVLEHHSGNEQGGQQRQWRPFGSSVWRRWPEFGYGLRPMKMPQGMSDAEYEKRRLVDFLPWRGDRDQRPWPRQMESGGEGLPWVETAIDYRRSA